MGVFGAGSQVWSEEQTLAYLHADLLFAVFRAELALSAAQQAQLASKRAHAAAAAAASPPPAAAAPPPPSSTAQRHMFSSRMMAHAILDVTKILKGYLEIYLLLP